MLAWLDNHSVKLEVYSQGNWEEVDYSGSKNLTPVFHMGLEYRLRPVKYKIRVAKFSPLYEEEGEEPLYVTVTANGYKEISSHRRFLQWVTEEMEVE